MEVVQEGKDLEDFVLVGLVETWMNKSQSTASKPSEIFPKLDKVGL